MIEILKENGFTYTGDCTECQKQWENWERGVIKVKIKKDMRRFKVYANSQVYYGQAGAGGPTPMEVRLKTVLANNGLLLEQINGK